MFLAKDIVSEKDIDKLFIGCKRCDQKEFVSINRFFYYKKKRFIWWGSEIKVLYRLQTFVCKFCDKTFKWEIDGPYSEEQIPDGNSKTV